MNPAERFLSVFTDDRDRLDRVPTFVQGVLGGFIERYESELFDNWTGEMTYNVGFDAALCLGFDSVFASMPRSVISTPITVEDEHGVRHTLGLSGQVERSGTSFYSGGLIKDLDILEMVRENIKVVDVSNSIEQTVNFYKSIEDLIFPVPTVGGIFDTTWQAMGFETFATHYRKRSKLYRSVIETYAEVTRTNIERILDVVKGELKILTILDDVAFKGHLMISPERWKQDIGLYYREIVQMIHDAGLHAIMHSDGDVTDLVPALEDVGFEGLQGWEGGADPYYIRDHHPEFVVIGFGDVGQVLPFGSSEMIEAHVRDLMSALKENRHYIFGPSTVIFKEISIENVRKFMYYGKLYGIYSS
ncbi:MAG: uroporphyrinogen decarboxylase family protein [Promethearchaeota archaeon]